jgi:hypothetical protein
MITTLVFNMLLASKLNTREFLGLGSNAFKLRSCLGLPFCTTDDFLGHSGVCWKEIPINVHHDHRFWHVSSFHKRLATRIFHRLRLTGYLLLGYV